MSADSPGDADEIANVDVSYFDGPTREFLPSSSGVAFLVSLRNPFSDISTLPFDAPPLIRGRRRMRKPPPIPVGTVITCVNPDAKYRLWISETEISEPLIGYDLVVEARKIK